MPAGNPTSSTAACYYRLAALGVVLLTLVAGVGVFLCVERMPNSAASTSLEGKGSLDGDANNDGNADHRGPPLGAAAVRVRAALDNDADDDGQEDGIADPLAVLASVLLLIALLEESFFL